MRRITLGDGDLVVGLSKDKKSVEVHKHVGKKLPVGTEVTGKGAIGPVLVIRGSPEGIEVLQEYLQKLKEEMRNGPSSNKV